MRFLLGLIVLIFDLIAIVDCLKSNKTVIKKLLWILLIFFFPILGMLLFYIFGKE